jgi:predicted secreted protein
MDTRSCGDMRVLITKLPKRSLKVNRSRKIVILCHCLLNANAKIAGLAHYGGALLPVVNTYLSSGAGIIQLPCPETTYLGVKRWGMTRDQYDTPYYRRHCRHLLAPYLEQLLDYRHNSYSIEAIVGIDGSPSCGVRFTCEGYCGGMIDPQHPQASREVAGQGVFIEELVKMLEENDLVVPFDAINENNPL